MKNKTLLSLLVATVFSVQAQTDDPNNAIYVASPNQIAGGIGAVLNSFTPNPAVGSIPVGLENDGSGNLLITDLSSTSYSTIDSVGALVSGPNDISANAGNPIGVTTNGVNIFTTDTDNTRVNMFDLGATFVTSFDVSGETTFPEGLTVAPYNNNIFVVSGSGESTVSEYNQSGVLQNSFPVNGSSQDGIAFDNQRCVFWLYDSGTDTVRSYDSTFNEIQTFPGTGAAGFGGGEGVGVIGNSLFIVATGANTVVEFDITGATSAPNASSLCSLLPPAKVPFLDKQNIMLLFIMMFLSSLVFLRKYNKS